MSSGIVVGSVSLALATVFAILKWNDRLYCICVSSTSFGSVDADPESLLSRMLQARVSFQLVLSAE